MKRYPQLPDAARLEAEHDRLVKVLEEIAAYEDDCIHRRMARAALLAPAPPNPGSDIDERAAAIIARWIGTSRKRALHTGFVFGAATMLAMVLFVWELK